MVSVKIAMVLAPHRPTQTSHGPPKDRQSMLRTSYQQNLNVKLLAEWILYPPIANTGSDAQSTFQCDVIMAKSTRRVKTRGVALMSP